MEWIHDDERLPKKGEPCWSYFYVVGSHRGYYGGLYEDEEGKVWPGMSIFYCDYGFLTGDVTHWHPDQDDQPKDPVIN